MSDGMVEEARIVDERVESCEAGLNELALKVRGSITGECRRNHMARDSTLSFAHPTVSGDQFVSYITPIINDVISRGRA